MEAARDSIVIVNEQGSIAIVNQQTLEVTIQPLLPAQNATVATNKTWKS
jgi:hypothetical protein